MFRRRPQRQSSSIKLKSRNRGCHNDLTINLLTLAIRCSCRDQKQDQMFLARMSAVAVAAAINWNVINPALHL
jgi:hypothetical protein